MLRVCFKQTLSFDVKTWALGLEVTRLGEAYQAAVAEPYLVPGMRLREANDGEGRSRKGVLHACAGLVGGVVRHFTR